MLGGLAHQTTEHYMLKYGYVLVNGDAFITWIFSISLWLNLSDVIVFPCKSSEISVFVPHR